MAITFVFCIESGPLEAMTIRAVESLRRWGGALAQSPVMVVKPRFGPALQRNTLQKFDQFGVAYLDTRPTQRYRWYNFMNKPGAVLTADKAATTELMVFVDSDVLFVAEPHECNLKPDQDIAAYAPNAWMATTGLGDPNEPFWTEMCQAVGIDINQLPFIETEEDHRRVRLYWNSGVFAYRKSTGYAQIYRDYCTRLLDARVAHTKQKLYYHEQIAMTLAGAKLRWKKLDRSHNFTMEAWSKRDFPVEQLQTARVIHYHDFMREENRARFMSTLRAARPDVAEFIHERGPLEMGNSKPQEWLRKGLKFKRGLQQRRHLMRCRML